MTAPRGGGPIAWMAKNTVAANLMMFVLLVGGWLVGSRVKQEVFPEVELDVVRVAVAYPGASPAEVEQGILLAIEEAVRGVDGVKKVTSSATEGSGSVAMELLLGADPDKALADAKSAIDRITSFPLDAEEPVVSLLTNRREVISLVYYADIDRHSLREVAERARTELLSLPDITTVELGGVRQPEISVEVSQAQLRAHGLTLEGIAQEVERASVELPGGGVKTKSGEVLLRTAERRDRGIEFEDIPIISSASGARVKLGDVARVVDGFVDSDEEAYFNGKPAAMVKVFRVGEQTPIAIADAVKAYAEAARSALPPGVELATWNDLSEIYRDRIDLLLRNAYMGLALVMLILGLFLELRVAFWVMLGIPVSFCGAFLLMPTLDVSLNMISLFAFIITLGIVVDDAIVVGENVYEQRQRGASFIDAAIHGTAEVAGPVVFSVLTTVAAFMPLLFVPGTMGKFFRVIPLIVISVLLISLLESLFILPAHLGHTRERRATGAFAALHRGQQAFARGFEWVNARAYRPCLGFSLRHRALTLASAVASLLVVVGIVAGGRIAFTFMPKVDADVVTARLTLPYGVPVAQTIAAQEKLMNGVREVFAEAGGEERLSRGVYTQVGSPINTGMGGPGSSEGGGHVAGVQVQLVPSDQRALTAGDFARLWREKTAEIVGVEALSFSYSTGPGGVPIDVQLSHSDNAVLERAARELADAVGEYQGVRDVDDGFSGGKPQIDFKLTPEARSLGITAAELGRQVRSAFYGAEALRQQRGRDELRVMVRLPESERRSEYNIEQLMIRVPTGGEIPFAQAAQAVRGTSYTKISRNNGRRVLDVTADVVPGVGNASEVLASLGASVLPKLEERYPGLRHSFEGDDRNRQESMDSLKVGFLLGLLAIFALLAIPLKSYVQGIVIMAAIPFGIVGAIAGHLLLGYDLSMISMMGIVAVSGIVVNDSLVLVHAANAARDEGKTPFEALLVAGPRRFRPIWLTSLTTFFGLAPMIFETSMQARFLIPMAISLGFGVLFSTVVTLVLVPSLYSLVEDARAWARSLGSGRAVAGERDGQQRLPARPS
jgi:multidrug efflux pump subunit AcrB